MESGVGSTGHFSMRLRRTDGRYCLVHFHYEYVERELCLSIAQLPEKTPRLDVPMDGVTPSGAPEIPELWDSLVETAGTGVWKCDTLTGEITASDRFNRIFGYDSTRPHWTYEYFLSHVVEDDKARVDRAIRASVNDGLDWVCECRIRRADGRIRWIRGRGKCVRTIAGDVESTVGIVEDFSDVRAVEDVLAQFGKERVVKRDVHGHSYMDMEHSVWDFGAQLRRLADEAPANVAIFEGPSHRCIYVNRSYANTYSGRLCLGLPAGQAFPEFFKDDELPRFDQVYESGTPLCICHEVLSENGSKRFFQETIQPWFGGNGSVVGLVVTGLDITEEVELRRELEATSGRFRDLADNMAQLAWMADKFGNIYWYNRRWLQFVGAGAARKAGNLWREAQHPEHVQRVKRKTDECLRTGTIFEDTFPLRKSDGTYRWFYSQAIPICDKDGRVIQWFGTHTDVTSQLEASRALEEADHRKNEFLAMVAHELRNPLAPVAYSVKIASNEGASPEERKKALETIDRQVTHMSRLIGDLLDVSLINRGKIAMRKRACNLTALVRETVDAYGAWMEATGLKLRSHVPNGSVWMNGDCVRLSQAIGNLLHNAGKFTGAGGEVVISLIHDPNTGNACIRVTDTGVGIPETLLPELFAPFSQAEQGSDRSKGGLGLGLSLVKGIAELHNGTVTAFSEGVGRGAIFELCLPLQESRAQSLAPHVIDHPPTGKESSGLDIVIIEDNEDASLTLGMLLQIEGHNVHTASDGQAGLKLVEEISPDVVLCDIGLLGDMNGFEVARTLRRHGKFASMSLFAISGYGRDADMQLAKEVGFDQYFVKPVDFPALSAALGRREAPRL
jgi:PAS domain S-box-containing protein